ncbi:MAG: hypothetical protein WBO66_05400, partial [Candidatus Moraniibacteriota bacterium]
RGVTHEEDASTDLRLTPEGRNQMTERGKDFDPQVEVSVGMGSPYVRTQETAYRSMLANEDIAPEDSLEDIERKLAEQMSYGKKMIEDDRLAFHADGPTGEDGAKAYYEKRYMPWVIDESDQSAIKNGDTGSSTFTRMTGNLAEIISRYATVSDNFQRIVTHDSEKKYEATGNQLERYIGTHLGISECFVAKVLEKLKGAEAKDEFVKSVGSGFLEGEGIHIEIINTGSEQNISMTYTVKDEEHGDRIETIQFGREVLLSIIDDRRLFEEKVTQTMKPE